jgi:hypothetical protein
MIKVTCGLSRKVSKDYQSTGYSINVEGEVTAPVHDAQAVIEQIKEIYDVAEEALAQQIERAESTTAIATHDEEPRAANSNGNGRPAAPENNRRASTNGNGHKEEPATNKQVQYLLSIGKRMRLSTSALEKEIADILGSEVGVYDLTKKQAGLVIDQLASAPTN